MKKNCTLTLLKTACLQKQLFLLFFLMLNLMVYGQRRRCGTDELAEELGKIDSTSIQRRDSLEKERLILIDSPEYQKFKKDHIPPKGYESGAIISIRMSYLYANNIQPLNKQPDPVTGLIFSYIT